MAQRKARSFDRISIPGIVFTGSARAILGQMEKRPDHRERIESLAVASQAQYWLN
jgi:hypothetical protein